MQTTTWVGSTQPAANVLIICTGGTIGMFENEDGALENRAGYLKEMLPKVFQFNANKMPNLEVVEWEPLIDSTNMRPELWTFLAKQIEESYDAYDGFVVLMGNCKLIELI